MRSYKRITAWESKRRIDLLHEFHEIVVSYYNDCSEGSFIGEPREGAEAIRLRPQINASLDEVCLIVRAAGITTSVTWTPPPAVGGYIQNIDVLVNLFSLRRYQIPPTFVTNAIERAHGVYVNNHKFAIRRTLNPFWWLSRVLLWFARIPFHLLGTIGFNRSRAEASLLGRLFKLLFALVSAIAATLSILHLLGWLPAAKELLEW